ncbi:hypothetical protein OSB04_029617 [Centaurea solstitialis]|uniref:Integrase catalytic domain-containing protein n=1 Tax=Centaurea solstitialis TaxID=347529 RepID=A0AA38W456_9ASTR|nr:hypothetical protein OSB04_029617 [Centaurea solstitialis]
MAGHQIDPKNASASSNSTLPHPALAVSNINSFIKVTLDIEKGQYITWSELFKIHARAYQVLDHIIPPSSEKSESSLKAKNPDLWSRVDAVVLQWIYGTISEDLLNTILERDSSAELAWNRLRDIFSDNKNSRALYLEQEFSKVQMAHFADASSYCQHLKSLSDQLSNVGAPVSNERLVLQLVSGLTEPYANVGSQIRHGDSLPPFYKARSMLVLEETARAKKAENSDDSSALLMTNDDNLGGNSGGHSSQNRNHRNNNRNTTNRGGRNASRGGRGRGNRGSQPAHNSSIPMQHRQSTPPYWASLPPWAQWQPWALPPCPYPTTSWSRHQPSHKQQQQPGVLGPRPQQAHVASVSPPPSSYAPTDIQAAMHTLSVAPPDDQWYMDTGATSHMTANGGNLTSYSHMSKNQNITVGSGHYISINGYGNASLPNLYPPLTLKNVLHAPKLIKNLVSVRKFTIDNDVSIEFDPLGFTVKDLQTGMHLMRCNSKGDLYPITSTPFIGTSPPTAFAALSPELWHNRLGHPGAHVLSSLRQNNFIICNKFRDDFFCHSCPLGKQVRLPFYDSLSYTYLPFDIVHSDVWTSPTLSSEGHRYYVLFLDDFTDFLWTFPIANKYQVHSIFLSFRAHISTHFEKEIKCFQCDNGKEYDNGPFHKFCELNGMSFRFSCPHTSPQNGKAERKIRTINNIIRTLLAHASLPTSFWHHTLQMATYLLNILPNKKLAFQTPTKILYQKDPSYSHLRVFGCLCYPLLPSTSRNKLQARSTPCVFLGYPSHHRGYKCYDLSSRKILVSRHVIFDENTFPFSQRHHSPSYEFLDAGLIPLIHAHSQPVVPTPSQPPLSSQVLPENSVAQLPSLQAQPTQSTPTSPIQAPNTSTSPPSTNQPNVPRLSSPIQSSSLEQTSSSPQMTTRSQHGIFKPRKILNLHTSAKNSISPLPTNPINALNDYNWKMAMKDEYDALIANKTWDLVPRPSNANIIRSLWIFRHKTKSDGSFERHKARLVGDGAGQQNGIDCGETFSPVVKPATIRTVLSIALSKSWCLHQLDVKNAFLHGNLAETVYMYQPPGFRDPDHPDYVCLLKKSLYGLKQAPRAWYQRFADYVTTLGFTHSISDHSLFIYRRGKDMAYILLYVDDIILVASSDALRQSIMSKLGSEFAMKDLGPLSYFLGISVTRHSGGLFLSQKKYAKEILERAGMSSSKPSPTPVDTKAKLSASSGNPYHDPTEYRRLAGALQYLTFTRPDISYAVQQVCLFMHDPRTQHMSALKRIIRYIQGTLDYGLHLYPSSTNRLISYTDADWGGCPDTRRSTSGYCVYLGDNLLSWSAKRQPTLSRSSAEAEYRGVANVVSESCWIRNLLLELHCPITKTTLVYCDNVSAVYLSGNPVQHQRTKHIEMDIHFVREKVARGQVRVLHVPSRYQIADIFTKGLPLQLFDDFRDSLNVRQPPVLTKGVY